MKTAPLPRVAAMPAKSVPPTLAEQNQGPQRQTREIEPWELERLAEELVSRAHELRSIASKAHREQGVKLLTIPEKLRGISIVSLRHALVEFSIATRKAVRAAGGGA